MPNSMLLIWLLVSLIWAGACAALAFSSWPHLPLDISHTDPGTLQAFDQAVALHVAKYTAMAVVPVIILYVGLRLWARKN